MLYALDEINSNAKILPNISLGAMILDTCRLGLMILLSQVNGINGDDDIYVFKLHKSLMFLVSCKRQSLSINQETFHSSDNSSSHKINVVDVMFKGPIIFCHYGHV